MPDDAVEALAGSLGKKELDPEDGKPVEDKVKVMAAQKLLERSYHFKKNSCNTWLDSSVMVCVLFNE